MQIKLGTRGSRLALWQAQHIQAQLQAGGLEAQIVVIETKGDQIQDRSLSKIGSKGLFTAELEEQLRAQDIDVAVHSAKDMQAQIDEDLEILAFGQRENPQDVVISHEEGLALASLPEGSVIGTSSTRRQAWLRHYYPHLEIKDIRGNLQTRLRKLEKEDYKAIILAYAGVKRMGYDELIRQKLALDHFVPPVGQGSIALQCHRDLDLDKKQKLRDLCNHSTTESCILTERSLLRTLEGGCSVPIFGLAQIQGQSLQLHAGIISLDGKQLIQAQLEGSSDAPQKLGHTCAQELLDQGGSDLLNEIRAQLH